MIRFNKLRFKRYIVKLIDIIHLSRGEDRTDVQGTIRTVKQSTQIRGATIWILCCGSLLASIGLDTNSKVLLISAMLISPLMTPVLGIGIFYYTHQISELKLALKKVTTAASVCIVTSLLYFIISPLGEITEEIAARIKPTLIDALVAFIGGITGIISLTRKDQTTVLPGVAVAITLMPPLCVIGYGISQWNIAIIMGAGYLFLINIVIICFVSSFIVRWLNFPVLNRVSRKYKVTTGRLKLAAMLVLLSPGAYWFVEMVATKEQNNSLEHYVNARVGHVAEVIDWRISETDSVNTVEIFTSGNHISEDTLKLLQQSFDSLELNKTIMKITQPDVKEVMAKINEVVGNVKNKNNIASTSILQTMREVQVLFDDVANIQQRQSKNETMVFVVKWNKLIVFSKKRKLSKINNYMELRIGRPLEIKNGSSRISGG